MADVYDYIDTTGLVVPDTSVIQEDVENEYKAEFGSDLDVSPSTPQGMLIVAEVLSRVALVNNNAALANQINPDIAGGIFLDSIMALTGIQRTPASRSIVTCELTGVAGTVVPAGSQAQTAAGDLFELAANVTLASSAVTAQFQSVETGPILAASGTLTTIVSNVLGWESVTNPADADQGQTTQSDVAARRYRRNTLAAQGSSLAIAMSAAVYQVEGVTSLSFRENIASTQEVIDGVTMEPHSIYMCVDGGLDLGVAEAMTSKKSGGCDYTNGASSTNISQAVTVEGSGQVIDVLFDRPDDVSIDVEITVEALGSTVADPVTAVKDAITQYASGELSDEPGLQVGTNVSPFEIAGSVVRQYPSLYVSICEIKKSSGPTFAPTEIDIDVWERASIAAGNITVTVV